MESDDFWIIFELDIPSLTHDGIQIEDVCLYDEGTFHKVKELTSSSMTICLIMTEMLILLITTLLDKDVRIYEKKTSNWNLIVVPSTE